jgi:hypothetical protein
MMQDISAKLNAGLPWKKKTVFNKEETHFTTKLDSNLRKKLMKCDTWNKALYGTENGTLRYIDQKYTEF